VFKIKRNDKEMDFDFIRSANRQNLMNKVRFKHIVESKPSNLQDQ